MWTASLRLACVPAIATICSSLSLGCGNDSTTQNDDGSSTSSSASSMTDDGPESDAGDASTTQTTVDTSGSETVEPDSDGGTGAGESTSDSGSTSTESESSASTDPESSSGESGDPNACPAGELGPAIPDSRFGNTFASSDDFAGSCGGTGASDVEFLFTAPAADRYTFDTQGSPLDTVLYVLDGECAGTELACNDDGDGSQSVVAVDLAQGQTVTVVVDGNEAAGLPFEVRVQTGTFVCPLADIGSAVPQTVSGDTTTLFDGAAGVCGGQAGRDAGYLFTAPADATYSFETFGSSFQSVVYVRAGGCDGNEISCGIEGTLADLTMGQVVAVFVDSQFQWGTFDLHIDVLEGTCPDQNLGNTIPQTILGDTSDGDNTDAGTCGGSFSADDLFLFTAPQDGLYQFDTFGSAADTVLYLQDGGCGGSELACNDDWIASDTDSRVIQGLAAGQTVMVGVDGNGTGAYTLHMDRVPCPQEPLSAAIPQSVNDTTLNGIDKLQPSCGDSGPDVDAPDYTYSFTAPHDGVFTFDTFGSAFDTVLYVLDGAACNGSEIACNDNFQFDQDSVVSVQLVANQTVTVVVDGDFGSQGAFTLNVGELSGTCPDQDLGNVIPSTVLGDTSVEDNAGLGSCGGLTGNDYSVEWTAPAAGSYFFDTTGSSFDAILYIRDLACNGTELACDLSDFLGPALVAAELEAGETVVVTVDGEGMSGDFVLDIDAAPPGGSCCIIHEEVGCSDQDVEDCVCGMDSFCCEETWDSLCRDQAIDMCGADCG